MSFFARNALEVMLLTLGIAERQQEGYAFAGAHGWDIGSLPILDMKAYKGARDPVDRMMIHVTGVTDGFGVQKWGPTGWRTWQRNVEGMMRQKDRAAPWPEDWRAAKVLPLEFVEQLDHHGMLLRPIPEIARFVALCSRYRNTPYHDIGSMGGYVFANRRHEQRSYHGNGEAWSGGNAGIGCSFDCSPSSTLTDFHITTFRATMRASHLRWLTRKRQVAITMGQDPNQSFKLEVVAHAQAKYPGRANDPGGGKADIWRRVVIPTVEQLNDEGHDVVINASWHWGTGHPLPDWGRKAA